MGGNDKGESERDESPRPVSEMPVKGNTFFLFFLFFFCSFGFGSTWCDVNTLATLMLTYPVVDGSVMTSTLGDIWIQEGFSGPGCAKESRGLGQARGKG